MKWTPEAENAVRKAPFFVRKKIRARVEKEAAERGRSLITIAEVKATQARYLSGMESEVKGYRLDACFGASGCPNRAVESDDLYARIEAYLKEADLLSLLKSRVKGSLKFHHEFSVTIADCPNACSQPQIRDFGVIGAVFPEVTEAACSLCGQCVEVCRENAVHLEADAPVTRIDADACLYCGQCISACPEEAISEVRKGFRVLLGGKLGRHPQLAREIPGIHSEDDVMEILKSCIAFYREKSLNGERFSALLKDGEFDDWFRKFGK